MKTEQVASSLITVPSNTRLSDPELIPTIECTHDFKITAEMLKVLE